MCSLHYFTEINILDNLTQQAQIQKMFLWLGGGGGGIAGVRGYLSVPAIIFSNFTV